MGMGIAAFAASAPFPFLGSTTTGSADIGSESEFPVSIMPIHRIRSPP